MRPFDFIDRPAARTPALGLALASLIAACSAAPAAAVDSYLPLQVGNTWHYADVNGGIEVQSISRADVILGRPVFVNSFIESKPNLGLEQYWMEGPDGDLLLAGFFRNVEGFGRAYDPPLLWLDAPLALGRQWLSSADSYELPGMTPMGTISLGQQVYEVGPLTVPAGTFDAFGVGQWSPPPPPVTALAGLALDGTIRTEGSLAHDWYSVGVGDVQYAYNTIMQLTAYEFPTPTAAASWGRIKSTYR